MSAHPLSGLVVAVVGASGELGSRIARGAAERGAHLVLVGRDERRLHGILDGLVNAASKAALTAADRALARELRRSGVDVVDVRPPHTETGLAGRPLAGTAPTLPRGLDPDDVVRHILDAIESGRPELASTDFAAV